MREASRALFSGLNPNMTKPRMTYANRTTHFHRTFLTETVRAHGVIHKRSQVWGTARHECVLVKKAAKNLNNGSVSSRSTADTQFPTTTTTDQLRIIVLSFLWFPSSFCLSFRLSWDPSRRGFPSHLSINNTL